MGLGDWIISHYLMLSMICWYLVNMLVVLGMVVIYPKCVFLIVDISQSWTHVVSKRQQVSMLIGLLLLSSKHVYLIILLLLLIEMLMRILEPFLRMSGWLLLYSTRCSHRCITFISSSFLNTVMLRWIGQVNEVVIQVHITLEGCWWSCFLVGIEHLGLLGLMLMLL